MNLNKKKKLLDDLSLQNIIEAMNSAIQKLKQEGLDSFNEYVESLQK